MQNGVAFILLSALVAIQVCAARGDVTLSSGAAELRLSDKAVPLSLRLRSDGAECLDHRRPEPFAEIQLADGSWRSADRASQAGGRLELGFADTDSTVSLAVESRADWLGLRVTAVGGTRPKVLRFVVLNAACTEHVGERLNVGWNDAHALCVMATSSQVEAAVAGHPRVSLDETVAAVGRGEAGVLPQVRLTALARGSALEGSSAAVIACATPAFKRVVRGVARDCGLPTNEAPDGTPVKDTAAAKASCLVVGATSGDCDRLVRLCGETGVRQLILRADAWSSPATPYAVNARAFPGGLADLRDFARRLKAAGLTAGIAVDLQEALPDEVYQRLSEVYGACGFEAVRFELAASRRLSERAVTAAQERVLRQLGRPVILTGPALAQRFWHALARVSVAGTGADAWAEAIRFGEPQARWPEIRRAVDAGAVEVEALRDELMPAELSGAGIWGPQARGGAQVVGTQFDELEYALARSVALDCPVALQLDLAALDRNPQAPELLRLVKDYETARLTRRFSEAERAPMREPGQSFTMIHRTGFAPTLAAVKPVLVGAGGEVRAMVGAFEGGSVATFWCPAGRASVGLALSPLLARIADFDDQLVVVSKSAADTLILPVSARRITLRCPTVDAAALERLIRAAHVAK